MSEKPPIDIESLLAPISEREPAGEWLRYEGTYDAISEARREDDESLPQGIWQTKLKRADFAKVSQLGQKALRERSKDLQIAVWLCEAWLKLHGIPGLCLGIDLCAGLLSRFWPTLYPLIEDGDASYRLAPIEFLSQKVALRLKEIPLTESVSERPPLTWNDWERALRNEKAGAGSEEILPAQFLASASATPSALFAERFAELEALQDCAKRLEAVVLGFEEEQPSVLLSLRNLVTDMRALIGQYAPAAPIAAAHSPDTVPVSGSQDGTSPKTAESRAHGLEASVQPGSEMREESSTGPIRSRAQAYQRLVEAADYLQRTEPHSPVPYLVKRAVAWGNMDLIQLLAELVAGDADRHVIYALLGVKAPH